MTTFPLLSSLIGTKTVIPLSNCTSALATEIQTQLVRWGYLSDKSYIDGSIGPITIRAFTNWKQDTYQINLTSIGSGSANRLMNMSLQAKPILPKLSYALIEPFEAYMELVDPSQPQGDVKAYQDEVGVWTIGYGSTFYENRQKVQPEDRINYDRAISLLYFEVQDLCQKALQALPVYLLLTPTQRIALASFAFNLGEGFYNGDGFESITRLLKQPSLWVGPNINKQVIEGIFCLYDKAGDVGVLAGLKRRRRAEAALFCFADRLTNISFTDNDDLILCYYKDGVSEEVTLDITS